MRRGSTTWRMRDSPISLAIQPVTEKTTMTRFKVLGAAAILSLMFATPVFAQAAIQEPGAFAFFYPNNDVLNGGRPTPAAGPDAKMPLVFGSNPYVAMNEGADGVSCAQRYRSYDPASGTFLGHDGHRHECR
jgi:hypothetical protein